MSATTNFISNEIKYEVVENTADANDSGVKHIPLVVGQPPKAFRASLRQGEKAYDLYATTEFNDYRASRKHWNMRPEDMVTSAYKKSISRAHYELTINLQENER